MGKEPSQRPHYEDSEWNHQVKVALLNGTKCAPRYMTDGSGCFDLFIDKAYTKSDWIPIKITSEVTQKIRGDFSVCNVFESTVAYRLNVPLGIKVEVPTDYVFDLMSRSGQAFKHNCTLANSIGQIDSDFRGEVVAMLQSLEPFDITPDPVTGIVSVAQGRLVHAPRVYFDIVSENELSVTRRGEGGFGSTGM